MATLPRPSPPYCSGIVRPKTPASASFAISSRGMSTSFRCTSCAMGRTSLSESFRNSRWIATSVSSPRPRAPPGASVRVRAWLATERYSAARVFASTNATTVGDSRVSRTSAESSPSSAREIVSVCPRSTPPRSWRASSATYSSEMSRSYAPPSPLASTRSAQSASWRAASISVARYASAWAASCSASSFLGDSFSPSRTRPRTCSRAAEYSRPSASSVATTPASLIRDQAPSPWPRRSCRARTRSGEPRGGCGRSRGRSSCRRSSWRRAPAAPPGGTPSPP